MSKESPASPLEQDLWECVQKNAHLVLLRITKVCPDSCTCQGYSVLETFHRDISIAEPYIHVRWSFCVPAAHSVFLFAKARLDTQESSPEQQFLELDPREQSLTLRETIRRHSRFFRPLYSVPHPIVYHVYYREECNVKKKET